MGDCSFYRNSFYWLADLFSAPFRDKSNVSCLRASNFIESKRLTGFIVSAATGNGVNTNVASNDRVWNLGVISMTVKLSIPKQDCP